MFREAEYPSDKRSIERIIREYDKEVSLLINNSEQNEIKFRKAKYIMIIFSFLSIIYSFKFYWIPAIIKISYIVPFVIFMVFYFKLSLKIKRSNCSDKKLKLKMINYNLMLICFFIYLEIFIIESIYLDIEWQSPFYIISYAVFIFFCIAVTIIGRVKAPKRFIKNYQYRNRKIVTAGSVSVSITTILVSIAYFHKPYRLIVIMSYIMVIVMCYLMAYKIFEYKQYDKIQELKKQI